MNNVWIRLKFWLKLTHGKGIDVETPQSMKAKLYRLDNSRVRSTAKACNFPKGIPARPIFRHEWKRHVALEFDIGTEQIFFVTAKPQTLTKANLLKNTALNDWIEYFARYSYSTFVVYDDAAYLLECRRGQLLLDAVKQGVDPRILALCET